MNIEKINFGQITKINLLFAFIFVSFLGVAQQLNTPNFAWASHPMTINKIEQKANTTVIELSITNKRTSGGNFCASKNIYIKDILTGKIYNLLYSKGIPVCPYSYKFENAGEVLNFQLFFPKLDMNTKYIDIIENCNEHCFSINGIILSHDFNSDINLGYNYYNDNKLDFAVFAFKKAIEKYPDYPFGKWYINLIQVYAEKGDIAQAKVWFNKLKASKFIDKDKAIHLLQEAPFYKDLIF